jgi:hypothetical protein
MVELFHRQPFASQEVEEHRWIEASAASPHDDTFERREAHRRVHANAVADGRDRRAIAQMSNHDTATAAPQHLSRPFGAVGVA